MVLEPPHLDPTAGAAAAIDEVVYANIFEGLTRIGSDGAVLPALAESWTISDDGMVYTFKLHAGVKFHDGTRLRRRRRRSSRSTAPAPRTRPTRRRACSRRSTRSRRSIRRHRQGDAEAPARRVSSTIWAGATRSSSRRKRAETNKEKPVGTGPFKFANWAKGSVDHHGQEPGLLGRAGRARQGDFRFIPDAGGRDRRRCWPATSTPSRTSRRLRRCRSSRPTRVSRW